VSGPAAPLPPANREPVTQAGSEPAQATLPPPRQIVGAAQRVGALHPQDHPERAVGGVPAVGVPFDLLARREQDDVPVVLPAQ
jgi:hypothetical protein